MKKRILVLIVLSIVLVNLSFISAGIYFSDLQSTYNLGELVKLEVSVDPIYPEYLLKVDLMCNGNEVIPFNNFPNEEGLVNIVLPLNYYTLKEVSGDCYFSAQYGNEERETKHFEISKRLDVKLDTSSYFNNPGETLTISGSAKRLNGNPINGEVEISIPLLRLLTDQTDEEIDENATNETSEEVADETAVDKGLFYGKVVDGEFSVPFTLKKNTPAGDYRIDILAYEQAGDKRASEGSVMAELSVSQVLTSVDVAIDNQNIDPGEIFSFRPLLRDQTGVPIIEEITVIIKNQLLERVFEQIVQSEETINFDVPTNLSAGYYEIQIIKGEANTVKKFYVNEKAIASFELRNETLFVTNIGNIPYKKDIQIDLNGRPFVKSIDLGLGETKEFKLTGSDGEYDVRVSDGENEISQGGIVLTGSAVNVKEVGQGISVAFKTPILWIFFIIILGGGILFLFKNIFKKKSFAYPFSKKFGKSKVIQLDAQGKVIDPSKVEKPKTQGEIKKNAPGALVAPSQAEPVLVLNGAKNRAAVIVIKIKNKIGKREKLSLEKAIEHVYEKRGAVYEQGDYIFIIFSPLMTRTLKNEIEAAKTAEKISLILKEHNKKYSEKIEFGIAVNSGDIINKIENKKLKFTALGRLITVGKRIAESSDGQVLVTKEAYQRGISEIKAEKKKINNGEVYEIKGIIDVEKNQKFIQGFLKRMSDEEKSRK